MRVMLDTNILISALVFPSMHMTRLFENIVIYHKLVLSSYVMDEFCLVMYKKFPDKAESVEELLEEMSYELVYTPKMPDNPSFYIRDMKDYPVIYTAITGNVDILITGDKDFENLAIKRPEIISPTLFLEKYGKR